MAKSQSNRGRVKAAADWRHRLHDPAFIARRAAAAARKLGLRRRVLARTGEGVIEAYESVGQGVRGEVRPRVYLSAGMHGDEAGGVEAILRWMEGKGNRWAAQVDFTLVPCINPGAIRGNTRNGPDGLDWNRGFAWTAPHAAIDALKAGVRSRGPFDLALLLHEDYDGCGLYLYELNTAGESWGNALLAAALPFLPSDGRASIDGSRSKGGLIARSLESPTLRARLAHYGVPEAAWLVATRLAPRVYTLEAPSEFDVERRADGLRAAVDRALTLLVEEKGR
ncbi:Succinylglutamate desuccinylase / Aspartoacylase family protein [Verrucomicrobium sp. GAS474]|uniref:M14 family metallopeptidase n=1 Tax=Verrucomicrobium sp. GAS474 TaxID=1882831 RepID=UPI000879C3CA|nr:M14 family metallocarboxypeptidase [Verrucomicrobium sp. GAS474]SDU08816.1 Succinylglutamate desuccinylase / Aspartoacylase family protein [Verrucomicrobium sp. GAS474]